MTENKNVETILKNGDKALSGMKGTDILLVQMCLLMEAAQTERALENNNKDRKALS